MKHSEKVKLARKLMSRIERKMHVPIFSSLNWSMRRAARNPYKAPVTLSWWEKLWSYITGLFTKTFA